MNFFALVNNSNDTFKLRELILQCSINSREFFHVDQMSNFEIVDLQNVCRVTLTQSVLRDRKKYVCTPSVKHSLNNESFFRI